MRLFSACVALATLALLPPAHGEVEDDLRLGLEAVSGYRTDYVYRGFDLAGSTLDFQFEGEARLTDRVSLSLGAWIAGALNDDFTELAGFADLRYDLTRQLTIGLNSSYHAFDETFFEDGFDLGPFLSYYVNEDWDFRLQASRDTGAEGWYASVESGWSHRLSDDAFLGLSGGLSWIDSYYDRSGVNDFYGRASLTYNVNSQISLTPFLGWSLEIEDGDGDELFGGLWFEVSF